MSPASPSEPSASAAAPGLVLGCDIGGTFTDFVLYDPASGDFATDKRLTTPKDPGAAVLAGTDRLGAAVGPSLARLERLVHGTTLGINALLERKGALTGMIVTRGFRDIIELRRGARGELWDLSGRLPEPLVPRPQRLEVKERIDSSGQIVVPLEATEVVRVLGECVRAGATSVAVCLLHSYRNPVHEREILALATEHFPQLSVSLSSDVLPQVGEYERFSATAANAYLRPVMERYLPKLERALGERGLRGGGLRLLSSEGSQCATGVALQYPIRIVESGPVGGVLAAQHFARLAGAGQVLTLDIGGTTAKTCLLAGGDLPIAEEYEVARMYRFAPGSGLPLNVPSVDLLEIGAGGGSLAWIDPLGMVEIGPESAGAAPGPACYGQGGTHPTLTDADVVLGLLDPESFRATARPVEPELARRAIEEHLARPLGRSVPDTAWLVRQVALQKMGGAISLQLAHAGADPRDLTLVAFGGAGPLYAVDLARSVGMRAVIVPPMAAVFSALGMVMARMAYTATRSLLLSLEEADPAEVERGFVELAAVATRAVVAGATADSPTVTAVRQVELRYRGQGRSLRLAAPELIDAEALRRLRADFHGQYAQRFGASHADAAAQMTALRVTAMLPASSASLPPAALRESTETDSPPQRHARAFAGTSSEVNCTLVRRQSLRPGESSDGPALVQEPGSTTFVSGDARYGVDAVGNLVIEL
jgi:N-methylhydantoinase A/oxoprolinase/acetone carboxylase beta subunit